MTFRAIQASGCSPKCIEISGSTNKTAKTAKIEIQYTKLKPPQLKSKKTSIIVFCSGALSHSGMQVSLISIHLSRFMQVFTAFVHPGLLCIHAIG